MGWRVLTLLFCLLVGTAVGDIYSNDGYCNGMKIAPSDFDSYDQAKLKQYNTELTYYQNCEVILGDFYILSSAMTSFPKLQEITGHLFIGRHGVDIDMPMLVVIQGETLYKNEYSLVFDKYAGAQFNAPNLILIRRGKILTSNSQGLCFMKTAIEYKSLMRLSPSQSTKDRVVVENSYGTCGDDRKTCPSCSNYCWGSNTCQSRPYGGNCACNKDPIRQEAACYFDGQRKCCDQSCDGPCIKIGNNVRCAACAEGKFFNAKTGNCDDKCDTIAFGQVCSAQTTCPQHLVLFKGRCITECPLGLTIEKNGNQYVCKGCPITLNVDALIGTCGRTCNLKVTPTAGDLTPSNVFKIFPQFGQVKYGEDGYEVDESLMCDTVLGDINADNLDVTNSELWFLSRLRYIYGKIQRTKKVETPILYYGNAYHINSIGDFSKTYLDVIEAYDKTVGSSLHVPNNFCVCTGPCHIPRHCRTCPQKREVIDDKTGYLATYCSGTIPSKSEFLDTSTVMTSSGSVKKNVIRSCHQACKMPVSGNMCNGPTSFDCTECKITLKDFNINMCVETCPIGYYQDNAVCKRCHATCIKGCTGPDGTLGPSGCNDCMSFVSAPSDASVQEPHCFKQSDDVGGLIAREFEASRTH